MDVKGKLETMMGNNGLGTPCPDRLVIYLNTKRLHLWAGMDSPSLSMVCILVKNNQHIPIIGLGYTKESSNM